MASVADIQAELARRGIAPVALSRDEAAAYLGLSPGTFAREVAAGTLPPPIPLAGRRRLWSRAALDRAAAGPDARPEPADEPAAIAAAIDAYQP